MSKPRKAGTSEVLRRLAVNRLDEGFGTGEVADLLGVTTRSVQRWALERRRRGADALAARPRPGRPPKLTPDQAATIVTWLEKSPDEFDFPTLRWTAPRVAELIDRELGVQINPRYLSDWLRRHGITPQVPRRLASERDEAEIAWWVSRQWPRIKKKRVNSTPTSFLPMKVAF
jgi:transposase